MPNYFTISKENKDWTWRVFNAKGTIKQGSGLFFTEQGARDQCQWWLNEQKLQAKERK